MWKHPYRIAVLTASDRCAAGTCTDESGPLIVRRMQDLGAEITARELLPDDQELLAQCLAQWCDTGIADLILTTGGTGLSPRDQMPEATLQIAHRMVPGIPEAMRAHSMRITPKGMLSRGTAVIRAHSLIINLPGSPKAASENLDAILPPLEHALEILTAGP